MDCKQILMGRIKKSICFVSPGLSGGGGMERSLVTLANYFSKIGYEISIVSLFKSEVYFDVNEKIKIIWPNIERAKHNRIIYSVLIIKYFRTAIKKVNPDAVISFGEWFNPYVILVTRFLGIRLFVSDRMGPNLSLGFMLETARKFSYRYANGIIAQTKASASILSKKTGVKRIKVIPNAVQFIDVENDIKLNQIVSVGRLSREKGHSILINAFEGIENKNWSLHLVGDGPAREDLEREVKNLKLTDRVIFHGHLKDFKLIIAQSQIFALPSFYEGFPNALVEAMSVPLACVSSDCVAGPSEIIEDGVNGLLVETKNIRALTKALNLLIDNSKLRNEIKENAYHVRMKYPFENMAKEYLNYVLN